MGKAENYGLLALAGLGAASMALLWTGSRPKQQGLDRSLPMPILGPESRVLLVGDSLAIGLGPTLRKLGAKRAVTVRVLAKSGTTISDWARSAELAHELLSFAPTVVCICLGTNDAALSHPEGERPELDALIRLCRRQGKSTLAWIEPPGLPTLPRIAIVRDMLGTSPAAAGAGMHRFDSRFLALPRTSDGVHCTAEGYRTWAQAIWSYLEGEYARAQA